MTRLLSAFLLVLTVSSPLVAQPVNFGKPFSLTNTRYLASGGSGRLASDGDSAMLFWFAEQRLRATRYVPGQARLGRTVIETKTTSGNDPFDAVWTGSHYLALVSGSDGWPAETKILGRLVDRNGVPIGATFEIISGQSPRVAFNGTRVLLVYWHNGFRTQLLDANGRPVGDSQPLVNGATSISVISAGNAFSLLVTSYEGSRLITMDGEGRIASDKLISGVAFWGGLATDGSRQMVLLRTDTGLQAINVSANGVIGSSMLIESATADASYVQNASIAWNGSSWTIAFNKTLVALSELHVRHIDSSGTVLSSEVAKSRALTPSMAVAGGRLHIAWTRRDSDEILHRQTTQSVTPISIATQTLTKSEVVTYATARQILLATASSADATLVVWMESGDERDALRAGVRRRDGSWTERQIAPQSRGRAIAGSDGREFVIAYEAFISPSTGYATHGILRLDSDGAPIGQPVLVDAFYPNDVAWNGTTYAFSEGAALRAFSAQGVLSPALKLANDLAGASALASDGDGFFTSWPVQAPMMCTCLPTNVAISGVGVRGDLTAIEPAPRKFIEDDSPTEPDVAWDGNAYVVVWSSLDGVYASRTLPASTATTYRIAEGIADARVAAVSGGTAILWTSSDGSRHLRVLYRDGTLSAPLTLDRNVDSTAPARIEPLGNDALAYVYSSEEDAEPHHGSSRIMMAIGTETPAQEVPDAPQVTSSFAGRRTFVLEWSAPEQPVTGYRVEYRVAGGQWNEYETFLSPDQRRFTYDTLAGVEVAFRVRALSEGGAGAYSNVVTIPAARRRAVR